MRLEEKGLTMSFVPVIELPPRPLMVTGCTAARVAKEAIVMISSYSLVHSLLMLSNGCACAVSILCHMREANSWVVRGSFGNQ